MKTKLTRFALPLRVFASLLFTLFGVASHARGDIIIEFGTVESGVRFIDLLANTANQPIQFFATGIAAEGGVDGFELDLQIDDGGTALGGTDTGPTFGTIDLISGTIWQSSSPNQTDVVNFPHAKQSTVDVTSVLSTDGLVGTIFIDTTGISGGEFELSTTAVAGSFNSVFFRGADIVATSSPNAIIRITAVPEPSSLIVIGCFGCAALVRRKRSCKLSTTVQVMT